MSHPYQCLLHCSRPHLLLKNVIVAASGPCLHTFNASDGEHLSTWPPIEKDGITDRTEPSQKIDDNENTVLSTDHDSSQRPPKRRKLSSAREDSGSSTEIVVENGNGSFEPPKIKQCPSTAIIKLVCDSTGRHVVAVTGDDKAIRVFGLSAEGHLSQFSER